MNGNSSEHRRLGNSVDEIPNETYSVYATHDSTEVETVNVEEKENDVGKDSDDSYSSTSLSLRDTIEDGNEKGNSNKRKLKPSSKNSEEIRKRVNNLKNNKTKPKLKLKPSKSKRDINDKRKSGISIENNENLIEIKESHFDSVLKRIRKKRRVRNNNKNENTDDTFSSLQRLVDDMVTCYEKDQSDIQLGLPATSKLSLLPVVQKVVSSAGNAEGFVEAGGLSALACWLSIQEVEVEEEIGEKQNKNKNKRDDNMIIIHRNLPIYDIRKGILSLISNHLLPHIQFESLKASRLACAITDLFYHADETPDNIEEEERLIQYWLNKLRKVWKEKGSVSSL